MPRQSIPKANALSTKPIITTKDRDTGTTTPVLTTFHFRLGLGLSPCPSQTSIKMTRWNNLSHLQTISLAWCSSNDERDDVGSRLLLNSETVVLRVDLRVFLRLVVRVVVWVVVRVVERVVLELMLLVRMWREIEVGVVGEISWIFFTITHLAWWLSVSQLACWCHTSLVDCQLTAIVTAGLLTVSVRAGLMPV